MMEAIALDLSFWVANSKSESISFLYLAVLPATHLGTVGYMVTGVRLVDLQGRQAALWQSTYRFGLLAFGPYDLLADIIWVGGDPNRQCIRDKVARTYMIRRHAVPVGSAPIRYMLYYMFTYNLMFAEVDRPQNREGAPSLKRGGDLNKS